MTSTHRIMLFTGLELTPKKVEYLKCIVEKDVVVKTTELATILGVDPSTVTKTLQELEELGLIAREPYHGVVLTPYGKEYGEFLLRRHRILGLILSHYGLSDEEACQEASRMECYASREAIDKMCRSMGHPTVGICGKITHGPLCMGED